MIRHIRCVILILFICGALSSDGDGHLGVFQRLYKRQALKNGPIRYEDINSSPGQGHKSNAFGHNIALQDQPEQESRYRTQAQYEEELRRRQELRRKHEEERQRRLEERRRLENERRRLEEERRKQEEERQREEERRRRQQQEQEQSQIAGYQDPGASSRQTDIRQRHQQIDTRQGHHQSRYTTHSPLLTTSIETIHQDSTRRTDSGSRIYIAGQPAHRTNDTYNRHPHVIPSHRSSSSHKTGYHIIPNQRQPPAHHRSFQITPTQRPVGTQESNLQSVQNGHRLPPVSQRTSYQGFVSRYEPGGQGQSQWFPHQEAGARVGQYYPYDEQETFSNCPDTRIDLRINGLDCQQAVQQFGISLCYSHEYTSRACCEVCRPKKQPSRIGCEYGDHSQQCSTIKPADCYDLRNRQICCETCEKLRRSDALLGCEYGDMSDRCETVRQNPGLCYLPDNQRICCHTCTQMRNVSSPGCPWGDYDHGLCHTFEDYRTTARINCYSSHRRRLCCQSCERLRVWLPENLPNDCRYGDRPVIFTTSHHGTLNCSNILSYFSVDECRTNPAVFVNCCYTCHRYLHNLG